MKASDLKTILEIPFSIEKSFQPITEYLYFNKNTIKVTNMEAYLKVTLNEDLPFDGCVLAEPLKKFLDSVDGSTDLIFAINNNVLMISHGKKNKFAIPMETLDNFPITPELKYTDEFFLYECGITEELIINLERASAFMSNTDPSFNGIFLRGNKIYSSNREVIYSGNQSQDFGESKFIPKNLLKFIFKFKKYLLKDGIFKFYKEGFLLQFNSYVLYFPNINEVKLPNFDGVLLKYQKIVTISSLLEFKDSVNRIGLFNEFFDFTIKNKMIILSTDSIIENIDMDSIEFNGNLDIEHKFKCNSIYMKNILNNSDSLLLFNTKEDINIKVFGMDNGEFTTISAIAV